MVFHTFEKLVARDESFRTFYEALSNNYHQKGDKANNSLIVVWGEGGIGKTRFLEEIAHPKFENIEKHCKDREMKEILRTQCLFANISFAHKTMFNPNSAVDSNPSLSIAVRFLYRQEMRKKKKKQTNKGRVSRTQFEI